MNEIRLQWRLGMKKLPEWVKNYLYYLPSMGTEGKDRQFELLNEYYDVCISWMMDDYPGLCCAGQLQFVERVQGMLELLIKLHNRGLLKD